uniref:Nucleolus and neural progenitor protein-like N-terminal domain-containing protein n=1 Tax=Opuntia streptacantha TaxID=393608 RepID=A0A7C9DMA7_OPUST
MASQVDVLEERIKSFLCQLEAESSILERIVYKNKNQHRRCFYFQYLLKVRRDLKLLHSVQLDELLDSCFHVISGRKAKQKANLLESLKRNRHGTGKFNFLERLLGAARLLSEMVEPMLKAAIEISTLLARSFFMGFSLMTLALLARLRVLVQQMLLDVVTVFNEVCSIAQKKQSIKITQDGIEVFREYYPAMEEVVMLECVWKTDKFVLRETVSKCVMEHQAGSLEAEKTPAGKSVRYRSIEAFLGDDEIDPEKSNAEENGEERVSNLKRKQPESPSNKTDYDEQLQASQNPENGSEDIIQPSKTVVLEGSSASSPISNLSKATSLSNKRVAFISVNKPAQSASNAATTHADESESKSYDNRENPLFDLFNTQDTKGSIF